MERYIIKLLRDTPLHYKGEVLTISEFRRSYYKLAAKDKSDDYLVQEFKNNATYLTKWFELIDLSVNKFKEGNWVWHKKLKKALLVVTQCYGKEWKPNNVSLDAVNSYTDIYIRKATQQEIDEWDLCSFCNDTILIGQRESYYFNDIWREIKGVSDICRSYISYTTLMNSYNLRHIDDNKNSIYSDLDVIPNGLKIGCKIISHQDIMDIAKYLKLV